MHYAIPSNGKIAGVMESASGIGLPAGSVALPNYAGIPQRPSPGHELAVQSGALGWIPGPTDAAWAAIRTRRDALLRESDWRATQASDRGSSEATAWASSPWRTYRQALRDITLQADPFNITWPTPPT